MDKIFRLPALALSLFPLAAVAQDRTWVAPSGSWDTPANWSGNAVPTAANNAFIGSGAATVGAGVSGTANTIILSGTTIDPYLTVSGGYLSSANALLGSGTGRGGFATINSGTWNNSGVLTLGDGTGGLGSITLNGGLLFSGSGSVVNYGTVTVFGGTWNNNGRDISIGGLVGGISMTSGLITNGNAVLGATPVGLSLVGLYGGTWNSSGVLTIGQSGSARLTVLNGNLSSGTIRIAELAGSSGELTLRVDEFVPNAPGMITTGQIIEGAGSGTVTLGSGTIRATGNQADFISGFEAGDVVLIGTGVRASVFDTNGFQIGINTTVSGTGWLTKVGAGTLTISGSQAYTGVTTVDSGTLEVAAGGVIDQSAGILVGATTPASLLVSGGYVGSQVGIGGGTSLMTGGTMNTTGFGVTGGSFTQSGGLITISQQLNVSTSGTVFVNGGTLNAANSTFFNIGVATGTGTLNISGGQVTSGLSYLGFGTATGRVTMTGGTWNASDLFVGAGGNSSLDLSGGNLFSGTSIVGAASVSSATVTGGTWTGSNGLFVGYSGTGTLTLGGSGLVNTGTLVLGDYTTDSLGTLNLGTGAAGGVLQTALVTTGTGSGAINFNGGTLRATANQANFLAGFDSNDVSLRAGGAFIDSNGFSVGIGTVLSGTGGLTKLGSGTLTLTGANSYTGGTTVSAGTLFQGTSGAFVNNTAYTVNGGTLDLNSISLTASSFSGTGGFVNLGTGTLTVNQSGATSYAGSIYGSAGLVKQGAGSLTLTGSNSYSGGTIVRSGTLAISSGGSINHASGTVAVGSVSGDVGMLSINGGSFTSGQAFLGNGSGAQGTVSVTAGTWSNTGNINVGASGAGTLNLNAGGLVTAQQVWLAASSTNSQGTVTVNGGTLSPTNGLIVGYRGTGVLNISNGVVSSGVNLAVGNNAASDGTINLTGGLLQHTSNAFIGTDGNSKGSVHVNGGTWNNSGAINVGSSGAGALTIDNGTVSSGAARIGNNAGSSGTATVNGGVWTMTASSAVGNSGTGHLFINGGLVSGTSLTVASATTSSGFVTVTGGTLANTGNLIVGEAGTGSLNLTGGLVSGGTVRVSNMVGSAGTLNLDGGVLQTLRLVEGSGTGTIAFNSGTLRARGDESDFVSGFEVADVTIGSGGAVIDSNGYTLGISTALSGTGGLTKIGAGMLSLSGNNSYAGPTTANSGTLAINGIHSGTGAVTVQSGATLSGTGTVAGAVTVQNGGTLATGNSIGTLTVGSAAFASGSLFSLEGGGNFFDSLVVNGSAAITSGALISFDLLSPLTATSYLLMSAASGLDGSVQFTLSGSAPTGYILQYSGTTLSLVQAPAEIGTINATPADTSIITGGTTSVVVTVENGGPGGGTDLDATVTGDGTNVTGTSTMVVAPQTTGTASPDLAFSSTTIGVQTGTVTVTDPNATNSPQTGTVTVNVLDHADPILTVSGGNSQSVIVGATGVTATLNLANGSTGEANLSPMDVGNLSTGLSGTTGSGVIGSGASADYTASLNTGTVGAGQSQVFSLEAGDQQSLPGANSLSTYSATVALNVYGHAEPVVSGSTFNLGYIHEGYTAPVVSNTLAVTNGESGDYIVDLKADGVTSGDLSLNGISGVGAGDSAGVAVTLGTGLGVGTFGGVLVQTYADDSSLAGASSNVGTVAYSVTGEVYSGHGVWNTVGGGSWGTFDSGFGVNWQAGGGSPGLDAAFTSTDTATFGTAGSGVVTLDGAAPSLKAITFDNATDSYALLQGTGGTITLNGGTNTAVIENLNGNHFIEAPLQLATNTLFSVSNVADSLTISGTIFGSGNVEIGGSGRTNFTQNQSYAGTTTVTSGVLGSRNLTGGAVNVNGGLFSPGNEGTISTVTVSTLNLNGGGLEFDLSTPAASDAIIVTGTTTLNSATQFTFLNSGFEAGLFTLVQSGTLANFGDLSGLTFVSDIDGLQGLFGVANNTLYFRGFTEDTIFTGPVLSNYAPYLIPTIGKFLVDGPVTTWPEDLSNTIDSLIFKNGSSLFVYNDLTVTSGDFTVRRGSATIDGGRVVVPGDFNLRGKGTLIAGSEFAIGGDANVNGGNLMIDGLFGIGKSANINNGGFLQVNQGGMMNVAEATNIHAGSIAQINGLLTSPQVNVSGLLKGTGVIAGNLWNNGIVAPGNSPGVLTVNGNYVQTSNGTLQVELGDLLLVSGNASLAGQLQLIAAGKLKYGQQITFLQAGSISGEFDEVLVPNPSKNRGRVLTEGGTGTLLIAPTSYTLVAETSNQQKVARALDSYIPEKNNDRETVSIALDLQAAEQYPAAFDQIAPTYYESLGNITIEQAFVQSQQLNQRLSAVRLGARGFQAIGIESPLRHDKDGKSVFEPKDAKINVEVETSTNWNIWAMGNGTFARVTGIGQLPNYNFNSGGFLVGGDYRWSENFTTGLFGGYQYTWADAGDSGNTQINSALFGGYATYQSGGFYADGIVGGGYNGYRVRRGINFSTVDRTARSQPNGGQFNTSLNLGYDWEIGKFTLGPIAGVQYAYAGIAPFSETGADSLDLRVAQQNVNSLRTTFGGRVAYTWNVTDKIALIPEVRMFWQHEFLNNPRNISSALDGGSGPTFGYETSAPARDSVFAGAGISAQFGERWNAFFYWNVDFGRQDYFGNSISGGLNWKF
jgi:fibronectin-binding autotransporter adhesin